MDLNYDEARRIGQKTYHRRLREGHYPYLIALEQFLTRQEIQNAFYLGEMEIPLSLVAGTLTEERRNSFASDWMPILSSKSEFASKWENLFLTQQEEGIRDAILCYEYRNHFYVQEGNKRVSVMKYVGGSRILARVYRIIPPRTNEKENLVYFEFLDFYRATGLFEIICSEQGSYQKIAEFYGQELPGSGQLWPEQVLEDLRSEFQIFLTTFKRSIEKGIAEGILERLPSGEAFLLYLNIFGRSSLTHSNITEVTREVIALKNEFLSNSGEVGIERIREPEEIKEKKPGLGQRISRVFSGVENDPLRIAFFYDKSPKASSWIYAHELGRLEIQQKLEGTISTRTFENCNGRQQLDAAFEAANQEGVSLVFTTSPSMMSACQRAALRYPEMKILNCSLNLSSSAVRTYYSRMYEAKFLMGAIAASNAAYSGEHRIAYLAEYPLLGTIADINAFAIGAGMIDPGIRIHLFWKGQKDAAWEKELQERRIRTISGMDMIRPGQPTRRYGIYQLREDGGVQNIAAPIYHWGIFYEQVVRSLLLGTWEEKGRLRKVQPINYWYGIASGLIDVIYSDDLKSYYSKKMMNMLRFGVMTGHIQPFAGELHTQNGPLLREHKEAAKEGDPSLSTEEIIHMNWLNDNVIGDIPKWTEIIESAQPSLKVSGVQTSEVCP